MSRLRFHRPHRRLKIPHLAADFEITTTLQGIRLCSTIYKCWRMVISLHLNPPPSTHMEILAFCTAVAALLAICKVIENYLRSISIQEAHTKCVLVTGCDSGFGHRLAQELDKRGTRVFAGCLTEDGKKRLTEKCSKEAVIFHLDVTKEDSIQNAVNLVQSELRKDEGKYFVNLILKSLYESERNRLLTFITVHLKCVFFFFFFF
jgi:retinol dehydrogenase-16